MIDPHQLNFRQANANDLPIIIKLLAEDQLGQSRESLNDLDLPKYQITMQRILSDPHNELIRVSINDDIVGTMQLTWIPYLSYQGSWRCLIESLRVRQDMRSQGIGQTMMSWAIERAQQQGCRIVQLTTDLQRPDAHRFYERLGFVHSHAGFKIKLDHQ